MQWYAENCGFWLEPSPTINEEQYQDIKAGIELVCRMTAKCARYLKQDRFTSSYTFKLKPAGNLYLSVCFYEGVVLGGGQDYNKTEIINTLNSSEFVGFGYREFDFFATRCSELLYDKAQGKVVEAERLIEAWENYIKNNPVLIQKVKEAQTDNNIFLEKNDLDEKER